MKQILVRYINIILGAIVAAFALEEFLVPANILDGGIVGTSIIISSITPISLSILTVCLNLPFVLVGAKQLEKSFLPRTIVAMGVFSLFLEIFNRWHYDATYDALLATCLEDCSWCRSWTYYSKRRMSGWHRDSSDHGRQKDITFRRSNCSGL